MSTRLVRLALERPDSARPWGQDVYADGVCFRRVDPEYLAWLRQRMFAAKRRFDRGRLTRAVWDELRRRFNALQEWAFARYGREVVLAAIRAFQPDRYTPPIDRKLEPYLFPKEGAWPFSKPVAPGAVRKVDAIRDVALAKGWSLERLYRNRGRFKHLPGWDYGLVCYVGPSETLGDVTERHIEVIHTEGTGRSKRVDVMKFCNPIFFPTQPRTAGALA